MKKLLALDLSTSCTGYAIFDMDSKKLLSSGRVKPEVKGLHKMKYPKAAYFTILDMASKVGAILDEADAVHIVIEEINRGISRIGQKSLDALHFFVLQEMHQRDVTCFENLTYLDSDGKKGWRKILGLALSEQDKQVNAEIRLQNLNKKKSAKAPLIDKKVLAQRWVNIKHRKSFNVWENPGDTDEVDAIGLGEAFLIST